MRWVVACILEQTTTDEERTTMNYKRTYGAQSG
jgi:hypothetical protein